MIAPGQANLDRRRLVYFPGVDGIHRAGEATFEGFHDCETYQVEYPTGIAPELDAMADEARNQLDSLGWDSATIFGESYGGALAQVFVSRFPERVSELVLISTFLRHPAPLEGKLASLLIQRIPSNLIKIPIRAIAKTMLVQELDEEQQQIFFDGLDSTNLKDIASRIDALEHFDSATMPRWSAPTAWLWGAKDNLVGYQDTLDWLSANREEDVAHVFDGAGHCISGDQRIQMIAAIREFLQLPELSTAQLRELLSRASTNFGSTTPAEPLTA